MVRRERDRKQEADARFFSAQRSPSARCLSATACKGVQQGHFPTLPPPRAGMMCCEIKTNKAGKRETSPSCPCPELHDHPPASASA